MDDVVEGFDVSESAVSDSADTQRVPDSTTRLEARNFETYNDAFEDEIAYSIDALDELPESQHSSPKTSGNWQKYCLSNITQR